MSFSLRGDFLMKNAVINTMIIIRSPRGISLIPNVILNGSDLNSYDVKRGGG